MADLDDLLTATRQVSSVVRSDDAARSPHDGNGSMRHLKHRSECSRLRRGVGLRPDLRADLNICREYNDRVYRKDRRTDQDQRESGRNAFTGCTAAEHFAAFQWRQAPRK